MALPPLAHFPAGPQVPLGIAAWTTPQLMAAGIFLFVMMALAFYAVLTTAKF